MLSVLALAGATLAAAAQPAGAAAQEQVDEAVRQFDASRDKVGQALETYAGGRREDAARIALSAYLDHFELVEPTLRVVDSDLTLELEDRYAAFRDAIEDDRGVGKARSEAASVRTGLREFEGRLESADLGAASLAFASSFTIIFREGLEAMLVLVALLGFLAAADQRRYRRPVIAGVAAAVVASLVAFVLLGLVLDAAPLQRELLEAVMTLVAVVLLFVVSFWLLRRIEHRHWMEFIRSRLWSASATGSVLAVAAVGFTAVFREGFETVLFYQALLFYASQTVAWVVAGFVAGAAALGAVGWMLLRLRRAVPVRAFMTAAVVMVMVLSVAFTGNAVNQLQNLDYLPDTSLREDLPRLPVAVGDLTGLHPTVESLAAQALLALVYLGGFAVVRLQGRRQAAAHAARRLAPRDPVASVQEL